MSEILVAEGYDPQEINYLQGEFVEGETGYCRLFYDHNVTVEEAAEIERQLIAAGATLTAPVSADGNAVVIPFKVTLWPLVIIGAGAILGGGFFGWQITKNIKDITGTVPGWVWIGGAALIVFWLLRSSAPRNAMYYTGGVAGRAMDTYVQGKARKWSG